MSEERAIIEVVVDGVTIDTFDLPLKTPANLPFPKGSPYEDVKIYVTGSPKIGYSFSPDGYEQWLHFDHEHTAHTVEYMRGKNYHFYIHASAKNDEDPIEEVYDNDEDDEGLDGYYLDIRLGMETENNPDVLRQEGRFAFPLMCLADEAISLPYLDRFIEVKGIDRINEALDVELYALRQRQSGHLALNEAVDFAFEDEGRAAIRCQITLKKARFLATSLPGRLDVFCQQFQLKGPNAKEVGNPECASLNVIDLDCEDVASIRYASFAPFLLDEEEGLLILLAHPAKGEDYYVLIGPEGQDNILSIDYADFCGNKARNEIVCHWKKEGEE